MTEKDDEVEGFGEYASPPCFMHELDPAFRNQRITDAQETHDVARWRKAERERLIAKRLAIPARTRSILSARIALRLDELAGDLSGRTVGAYWPFRGEPNLYAWMRAAIGRGARVGLPVVVKKGAPLVFRNWTPGARLEKGVWNIPVPADGAEVSPDVIVSPLVGFDAAGYRLGYGGGFYDRTLAAMAHKPVVIGVGYEFARLPTIYPQWHDIPMDHLVVV